MTTPLNNTHYQQQQQQQYNISINDILNIPPSIIVNNATISQIPLIEKFANELLHHITIVRKNNGHTTTNGTTTTTITPLQKKTIPTPNKINNNTCHLCHITNVDDDLIPCACHNPFSSEGILLCEDCLETSDENGGGAGPSSSTFHAQFCQSCDRLTCINCDRMECDMEGCDSIICHDCHERLPESWIFCECENSIWCSDCKQACVTDNPPQCEYCERELIWPRAETTTVGGGEGRNGGMMAAAAAPAAARAALPPTTTKRSAAAAAATATTTPAKKPKLATTTATTNNNNCTLCDVPVLSTTSPCLCSHAVLLCDDCLDDNSSEYAPCHVCCRVTCPHCDRMMCDGPDCHDVVCQDCFQKQQQQNRNEEEEEGNEERSNNKWTFCKCENSTWCGECKDVTKKSDERFPDHCGCCDVILACSISSCENKNGDGSGGGDCEVAGECEVCEERICEDCIMEMECDNAILICTKCAEDYKCDCEECNADADEEEEEEDDDDDDIDDDGGGGS